MNHYNTVSLNMTEKKRPYFCSTYYEHIHYMMTVKPNTRSNYPNSGSFKYNYISSLTTSKSSLLLQSDLKILDSFHFPVFLTYQCLLADQYSQFPIAFLSPRMSSSTVENPHHYTFMVSNGI